MNNATDVILSVQGLSVALPSGLDRKLAVDDVSFEVRRRQIVCLIGESGSGKSVTASAVMRLLSSSLRIVGGRIVLDGEVLTEASADRLCELRGSRMAMVFQEPLTALNPVMRVGQQIAEVLRIHKPGMSVAAVNARVIELMTDVRLPNPEVLAKSYPHQISGGQRQRIMIAMALALEPALIIADEPTTALDVTTQANILRLFRELLTRHNSGVLLITHDFGVVSDVADQVVVMRHGRVVERGRPEQVLATPSHDYTKALINAVPAFKFRPRLSAFDKPILDVRDLTLVYRNKSLFGAKRSTHALDRVSFQVARGETLGIVGESGSGKTSLAKCLMRFENVEAGEIVVDNRNIAGLSGEALYRHRRNIQMIFQDPYKSLNPRRRVGASLIEGPVQYGASKGEATKRAAELMELVGLKRDALDRFPHEFSGGQRQRICIARALAMEPAIIVADEPVSALDVSVQAQVLRLFDELRNRIGFSMIFITHDLRIASNVCDRVAVMQLGKIVEMGPTEQLFCDPQHAYTRELIASTPGAGPTKSVARAG
ncbi:dipeptide ABC transporter ATP-binding protein [Bradyrhizobium cenepequi]